MKKLILLLSAVFLFGANLINVDFFEHKNFVDILLSFDSKFNGKVVELNSTSYLLKNVVSTREYIKKFNKKFLKEFEVIPQNNSVKLIFAVKNSKISFALTPEGYGIRIRVKNNAPLQGNVQKLMAQNPETSIDYFTYVVIISILIILGVILWIVKKRAPKLPMKKSDISMGVLLQKPIDPKNRIVLFEFNKRKYLMLVGNTNLLLDVFDENMVNVSTPQEFDDFLKLNNKMDEIRKYIQNAEKLKEFDERI